jgi:hypothetical protein
VSGVRWTGPERRTVYATGHCCGPRDEVGDHAIPLTKPCQSMAEVAAEIERLKCELDAAAEAARNHFGRN